MTHQQASGRALAFHDLAAHAGHHLTVRVTHKGALPIEARLVCITCGRELRQASSPAADAAHIQHADVLAIHLNPLGEPVTSRFTVRWDDRRPRQEQITDAIGARIPVETIELLWVRGDAGVPQTAFNALWAAGPTTLLAPEQAAARPGPLPAGPAASTSPAA